MSTENKIILVKDLIKEGLSFGPYAGSKSLVPVAFDETSSALEYRPLKGGLIDVNDECDFDGFRLCNYGSSGHSISVKIKINSIDDLREFCKYFETK